MTKDILLSISGLQFGPDDDNTDSVEVITPGEYYYKNGKHYIIYEELQEGFSQVTKNLIKLEPHSMNITKKGLTNVNMVFEKNKKNVTYYETPFGNILVGISAKNIDLKETKDNIDVVIDYALEMNYEHLANCSIIMNIKSKEAKDFTLQ